MNNEKDYIYEVEIELSVLNENNIIKPYGYQNLFAQIAEQHLNRLNVNINHTMKHHLAWVLMSLSFEILQPLDEDLILYANTWYSKRQGPFFRREFVFKNKKGQIIFHGSTFSVLLDMEKRTIFRKKELPFQLTIPNNDFTIIASPSFKTDIPFKKVDERKVYNSYIDRLGHVNNCRYGEFAYDTFTDEERDNLKKLKRMDIYFLSELRLNDKFTLHKAYEDQKILVRGYNDTKNTNAFDIVFQFED